MLTQRSACRVSIILLPPESTHDPAPLSRLRVHCPVTGQDRTGIECASCPRFVAWGLSTVTAQPWMLCRIPCACCGSFAALDIEEAVFCDECRERAGPIEDDAELGGEA